VNRAFTLDIETVVIPSFRERVGGKLERQMRLGGMRLEQQQRYLEDIAAEEERCYQLGSLNAHSGRVLSIAVQVGPLAGVEGQVNTANDEYVFGIDTAGNEEPEKEALSAFLSLLRDFNPESDEIVGHNIVAFDLPFIFQRCLANGLVVSQFVSPAVIQGRCVFDTMHRWWLGAKRQVSLDDVAWALGIQSSKTEEVEGGKVFDLYNAGRLDLIREYNLNDVRVTRKVYERIVACFGR
jgi:DNA polymerase elongation subunit (family B)